VGYHDAFLVYAKTIKSMIENGENIFDGRMVTNRLWNNTYEGLISGNRKINENGDGEVDLSLHDFDTEGNLYVNEILFCISYSSIAMTKHHKQLHIQIGKAKINQYVKGCFIFSM
jgi:hypothetical protein